MTGITCHDLPKAFGSAGEFAFIEECDAEAEQRLRVPRRIGERTREGDFRICGVGPIETKAAQHHGKFRHRRRYVQPAFDDRFRFGVLARRAQQYAESHESLRERRLSGGRALKPNPRVGELPGVAQGDG